MINDDTKDLIQKGLREGILNITFKKRDGSVIAKYCTLQPFFLPEIKIDENAPPKIKKTSNPDVQVIWDIDAEGWRSFRWENFISYEVAVKSERG